MIEKYSKTQLVSERFWLIMKNKEYHVDKSGVVHFIKKGEKYKVTK